MPKPKVGIYYDLPAGGAKRLMDNFVDSLAAEYELFLLPPLPVNNNRLARDWDNFVTSCFHAQKLVSLIKLHQLQAIVVSHDSYFAAPTLLATSPVPTLFYCHEPTRALFEKELGVDPNLPLLNRIYESIYRKVKKSLEKGNASRATITLTNSNYSAEYIKRAYGRVATVVYPGVSLQGLSLKAEPSYKSILVVGNDEPQKRLALAVLAVAKLPKSNRPTLRLVCPRTAPSSTLTNLARRHGVNLVVEVGITDQELVERYQEAKVTLITALREPFGLSALESIACGTPVVAVAEGGVQEIIQHEINGYLSPANPAELAKYLKLALKLNTIPKLDTKFTQTYSTKLFHKELNKLISSR